MKPVHRYAISLISLLMVLVTWDSLVPAVRYVGLGISVLALATWLLFRMRSDAPFRVPWVAVLIGAYILLQAVLLSVSLLPQYALENVIKGIGIFAAVLFIVEAIRQGWAARHWENALISLALVISGLELVLAFFWFRGWWSVSGSILSLPPEGYRISGLLFGHPNILAGFLNLVLPITLARFMRAPGTARRLFWCGILSVFVLTEFFASSRGAWLGALAGLGATGGLLLLPWLRERWQLFKRERTIEFSRRNVLLAAVGMSLALGVASLFVWQGLFAPGHAPLSTGRSDLWGPAWRIIQRSPVWGHGPGSYGILFALETKVPPGFSTTHAHNLWLQVLAETGLFGLLLVAAMIMLLTYELWKRWRSSNSGEGLSARTTAYAGAMLALLVHHQLDYLFESSAYAIGALIILALIVHEVPVDAFFTLPRASYALIFSTLLLIFLVGSVFTLRGSLGYWEGVKLGRSGDWADAQRELCAVADRYPRLSIYGYQCALASSQVAFGRDDAAARMASISSYQSALEVDPYWPVHWANLGALEWVGGDDGNAIDLMRHAARSMPRYGAVALNLGLMEEALGHLDRANSAYLRALEWDPWLMLSGLLERTPHGQEALSAYELSESRYPSKALVIEGSIAFDGADLAAAESRYNRAIEIDPGNGRAYGYLARLYAEMDLMEEAKQAIDKGLFFEPADPIVLHCAARVAAAAGDEQQSRALLIRAYEQIRDSNWSSAYYYGTYHRYFLQRDLTPYILHRDYTAEMLDDLDGLASLLRSEGEIELSVEIQRWLEGQRSLPLLE